MSVPLLTIAASALVASTPLPEGAQVYFRLPFEVIQKPYPSPLHRPSTQMAALFFKIDFEIYMRCMQMAFIYDAPLCNMVAILMV